jgi:hypothetical protein
MFTYQGQRFFWGYSPDRQTCGLWEADDPAGSPYQTWPISEHEDAWRVFRSLEPFATACDQPVDTSSGHGTERIASAAPPATLERDHGSTAAGFGTDIDFGSESVAPGVVADFPGESTSTPRWRLLTLIVVLVVVVAAGAVFGVRSIRSKAPVVSPAKAVLTAATTTQRLHSARMSMTETITGPSGSATSTVSASGDIEFSTGEASLMMTVGGEKISVLSSNGSVFISIPQISQLIPGKSWVSVPVSNTSSVAGGALSGANPEQMLQLLASQGNVVSRIGSSTVDGVAVDGYEVLINNVAAEAQLSTSGLPASVVQAEEQFLKAVGPIVYKLYVDSDNQLRAMDFAMTVPGTSETSVAAQVTFSDFGVPVSLTAPSPSAVASWEQFLYVAVAAGESTSF